MSTETGASGGQQRSDSGVDTGGTGIHISGLTKSFLGRASYTIDARRSVAFEAAERQNGAGTWARAEYSQTFGAHWRGTAGFSWIRGNQDDFLGQYRRNSHFTLAMRYSF